MEYTLITGASGGIGEALAHGLAARKHNLVLVARSADKLRELHRILTDKYKTDVKFIAADLSKPDAPRQLFDETQKQGLEISMLINNAGIGSSGEFTDIDLNAELSLLQLNITSMVHLSHLYLAKMKKKRKGTLINIASMTAFMPVPYMATYAASKVFVRSFTEALTQEYKPYGIQVMLLSPGLTRTNFNEAAGLNSEKGNALSSDYSNAPTQTPEEVATETLSALDKKKHFHISGSKNRWGMRLLALLPNRMITGFMADSYRKKINQNL
ncbi:SDR family oxidoreductase [Mucilaginibacter sp. Bleaf8]|uniref:SDR family NAD(P)-dependent oxidoreductase n=1 Tax=Mucilaginibacter sp. Bleaf8 TaxID=2834430 RepID=UPI001BCDA6CF|nr:SDR family oxidoreductase [Mucilaginibacter sp. Bleaf8]MBS7564782.1 SDR family oxidoreductase [Mucilaginibacter sp. Bleaf8]